MSLDKPLNCYDHQHPHGTFHDADDFFTLLIGSRHCTRIAAHVSPSRLIIQSLANSNGLRRVKSFSLSLFPNIL